MQISLGHPFSRGPEHKTLPVKLYSRSGQDSLHLWSSLKLVITSKSDISAVPHSVILPLADEREIFSFQIAVLETFTLELSLYPTFGSKVIGRAILLPSTFLDIASRKSFIVPLLDHQLKAIGEVAFEVSCIRPFEGAQLEIGGRVETYWKSKITPPQPQQDHARLNASYRPLSVSTSSPALRPAPSAPQPPARESALVTASSLSGEYINIIVQVTKDLHPVVYSDWRLPVSALQVGIPDITLSSFQSLASTTSRTLQTPSTSSSNDPAEWYKAISISMTTLAEVLERVPDLGINVQLRYVRDSDASREGIGRSAEVNAFVDAVLRVVYAAGRSAESGRKVVFSSFEPEVCTALNWKQPNCKCYLPPFLQLSSRADLHR